MGTNAARGPAQRAQKEDDVAAEAKDGVKTEADRSPMDSYLAFELELGANAWLGDSGVAGLERDETLAAAVGGGIWYAPVRDFAFGISGSSAGLGSETTTDRNSIDGLHAEHDLATVWLRARAYAFRPSEAFAIYLGLGAGLTWQHIELRGTRPAERPFLDPPEAFSCEAWEGPHPAFSAGPGLRAAVTKHVALFAESNFAVYNTSGDPIEGCSEAPGVGTALTISGMMGLSVALDLSGDAVQRSASLPTAVRF